MAEQRTMARRVSDEPEDQRDAQRGTALRDWPAREAVDDREDKLSLPPTVKEPDGFVYERKRYSILGKPDTAHWNRMLRGGWRPVPARRHPELSPDPESPDGWIMQDGLVLCERPQAYSDQARREERSKAAMQVGIQLDRIGHTAEGTAPRVARKPGDSKIGMKQTYDIQIDPAQMPDPAAVE